MKPNFTIHKFHLWLDVGWFSGSSFKLFGFTIWETNEWKDKIDMISVVDFQLLKFSITFGYQR